MLDRVGHQLVDDRAERGTRVHVETEPEIRAFGYELDASLLLPPAERDRPRGTHRGPYPITLPDGWMSRDADAAPAHADAELVLSGG